jgi:hypothetical protein
MLHDSLEIEQVVDREAALEFMKEATKLASVAELEDIGLRLEAKRDLFQHLLAEDRIGDLDEIALRQLAGWMFSLKRKSGRLLRANGLDSLRKGLTELLYGPGTVGERFENFVGSVEGIDQAMAIALASESLHFTRPDRYWLWSHWLWNPQARTGALALVTQDDVDLQGERAGEIYEKVGRAMAHVTAQGHGLGYTRAGRGLFGTDVFLACVYAVYMYTVFRVKLSQEFNRILPELPELVERVLGVHQRKSRKGNHPNG